MDAENKLQNEGQSLEAQVKAFFDSAPPLNSSHEITQKLNQFIQRNSSSSARRIVCVTSGGTTAPLEQRCVRYVDNFSSGHRGATSTEYFLKAGYAVIFLYRRGSFQPFCRSLPEDPLLECFEPTNDLNIQVRKDYSEAVKSAIVDYHTAVAGGHLLKLPFGTIFEYLQMLQIIGISMRCIGQRAMFYLAAAVSDYYVPWKDMLETDSSILLKKANAALEKYKMHAVVANELSTRKEQVVVTTGVDNITVLRDNSEPANDVEKPLIKLLSERHATYIEDSGR
ncbi:hypothetical protein TSUD_193720 [Trifolium subterraneum]|uniref:Uncharacterized protein n=1 Tax=Trifolium subterraneum TaxID=3900 RepID=A0A2Z6LMT0_TRISU|nr:hypothetical protein TSUD_193720 [Trifolium subterraneum]